MVWWHRAARQPVLGSPATGGEEGKGKSWEPSRTRRYVAKLDKLDENLLVVYNHDSAALKKICVYFLISAG